MAGRSPALIVKPVKQHTATVIFAHGLGDSGAGWMSLASNWRRRGKFEHVKFIFPNAPNIPITVNHGMNMPGWFDIKGFDDAQSAGQDELGVMRTKEFFDTMILTEVTLGIPSSRIVIGGFSQGGAVALLTGLTSTRPLAGIVGLSSFLPIAEKIPALLEEAKPAPSRDVPIFMGHGDRDPLVKPEWGQRSAEGMRLFGWKDVTFNIYPGLEHSADPQEIDDLEKWLEQRLPDTPLPAAGGASSSKA